MGANFREKAKVAVRINFRGFNFCDWMEAQQRCMCMRIRSTEYTAQHAYGYFAHPLGLVHASDNRVCCRSYTIC